MKSVGLLLTVAWALTPVRAAPQEETKPVAQKEAKPDVAKITFGFEDQDAGAPPKGWTAAETGGAGRPAKWAVSEDPQAPGGKKMVKVVTENSGSTFNLLLSDAVHPADLELKVKVRADAGEEDRGGGPVWRARDASNYYVARWNPLENNLRVYKVEAGKRSMFKSATIEVAADQWHEVGIRMKGPKGEVSLDGKKLLEFEDATFPKGGKVGLWSKADASCSFDELEIGHEKAK